MKADLRNPLAGAAGMAVDPETIKKLGPPEGGLPFEIVKLGHVVLNCTDVERSARFYTEILGFEISDVYPEDMVPGGMVFMRFNEDHHGVALVGSMKDGSPNVELNHMAFEVSTLDEVIRARNHLKRHGVRIDFEGRRRAGVQIAVEFRDPDGHRLEIYWGLDRVKPDGIIRPSSEWKLARSLKGAVMDPVRGQDTTLKDPSALEESVSQPAERDTGGSSRW
jgi:catechol 2,3-dioxygenase-like lactoylglutathione lyase family enzyme